MLRLLCFENKGSRLFCRDAKLYIFVLNLSHFFKNTDESELRTVFNYKNAYNCASAILFNGMIFDNQI